MPVDDTKRGGPAVAPSGAAAGRGRDELPQPTDRVDLSRARVRVRIRVRVKAKVGVRVRVRVGVRVDLVGGERGQQLLELELQPSAGYCPLAVLALA